MDNNLSTQYENYFQTFRTEGWKQLIEDMQAIYDAYRIEDIKDSDELAFVKGERRILSHILYLEEALRLNYDALKEGADD